MSRTVQLSDKTAEIVQRKVDQGMFADAESAVAEAVRLLDELDDERDLLEKLQVGIDQIARGDVLEWTSELNDRLFEEAMDLHRAGVKPDPDVSP